MVLIQRERNIEGGTRDFWSKIVRRWIEGSKVVAISEVKEVTVAGGAGGTFLVGTKVVGGKTYKYLLLMVINSDYIHTCEAWGLEEAVTADQAVLESSFLSLRVKP